MSENEPVWITGVGLATPLGHDAGAVESALLAGRSGIARVSTFGTDDYPSRIAGQVVEVPCPAGMGPSAFRRLPRVEQAAAWCVESALRDSGLWGRHRGLRIGLVLGIGAEWMEAWEDDHREGGDRVREPARDRETTLDRVARAYGLSGPAITLSAACAASNFAIEIGRNWLRRGLADACLAGGCEMAVTPIGLATFGNLKALSRRNDEPARASRPFDRARDGFVLGEGGGVFVLERAADARRRSARAYAEVLGCGSSSDAHHPVIPSPDPSSAGRAVARALADAGLRPDQVDHINAHATSTPVGDAAEAAVLRLVFGEDLGRIPVTSTKSMTGHLLTAAGAVEAVACIAAMRHRAIPPTINLDEIDAPLDVVANVPREHAVEVAVSNSFGFGGSNSCLVLKAVEEPIGR
ncbi:3-oxoacyl-[acyl-carrier-protein] synthase 2 [Aquisphaera giovannonii]|uniref:3-oxoacyl-[acyl-carrier-protein] synthase 2 n=1 Tax=Aquisphaera giovannonii TaxID=406548 RepID=A0A5B9W7E7_9BACT|nr:beta-ketoacyl-[acyl-carrier-protein] synthase family protein [Aquisphaera giovannonii]QEH36174.1 3-oxoacyl-[acyl-carrier-protein] synthase 2 [Aquisphaera giovannonii]